MICAIIQARTGSKRLANKVFTNLCNKPLIWHVVNRIRWCKRIEKIILAIPENSEDDKLSIWAKNNHIDCFRGSQDDVLSRYYNAALSFKATTIIRITADDPFKDPIIIDNVIDFYFKNKLDFAYNNNPPSFPEGLDTEIFSFSALQQAEKESNDPFEREHVTQFFYRNPDKFRQMNYKNDEDISFLRWTIDTSKDLKMVEEVYNILYNEGKLFKMNDILKLLRESPYIKEINKGVKRSDMYINNVDK